MPFKITFSLQMTIFKYKNWLQTTIMRNCVHWNHTIIMDDGDQYFEKLIML
jgi:hypothetical protein